jgi:hypothetical protein
MNLKLEAHFNQPKRPISSFNQYFHKNQSASFGLISTLGEFKPKFMPIPIYAEMEKLKNINK